MDIDDLSNETYNAIIGHAENFHPDLSLEFGALAYSCINEGAFLREAKTLICQWLSEESQLLTIRTLFYENRPTQTAFKNVLLEIIANIETVMEIPIAKRKFMDK